MLEPGTTIKIKSAVEIDKTLNANSCCDTVLFTQNMYRYCDYTCSIAGYSCNGTYQVNEEGPNQWNWLPKWFDVIKNPNDFWNNKSVEQRSLCLALYRQALSKNMPCIDKLDQGGLAFMTESNGGFDYIDFKEDRWDEKIANNLPNWKWLDVNPKILEKALTILYNAHGDFKTLERNPNSPAFWFDSIIAPKSDTDFAADFISKYLDKPIKIIEHENKLQRKKSDLVRGTVPEGNIICGRKRKASVGIGHLSNKVCFGI